MKYPLFVVLGLAATPLYAGTGSSASGTNFTSGPSGNHTALFSADHNPAMNNFMVREEETYRFNFGPAFSYGIELGDVGNFADDLDDLIDIIDDPDSTDESPSDVLERFNSVLENMGEHGYIKNTINVRAPVLPLFYKSDRFGGTFSVDFSLDATIGARVLDDELKYDQDKDYLTNTAIYLKSGIEKRLSFGYGRELWSYNDMGKLYGGARLDISNMELSKQVMPLQMLDGRDISDVMTDEYDKNLVSTTAMSVDIGVVWDADFYRLGLTLADINSPSFDYGAVGVNCDEREPGSTEQSACYATEYFIEVKGDLKAYETHTKHARATVDGALHIGNKWWLTSALDLAAYDDPVGFENQWFHLAASYETGGFWLPSLRSGYQVNLTGSETSSLNVGATFFKMLNFDIEYGLESVEVDGSTGPRRLGFALSLTEHF